VLRPSAILFDFGDTLADEGSEQREEGDAGLRVSAKLLPGAAETVRALRWRGYPMALAVDCIPGTGDSAYVHVLGDHGILDCFTTIVTSDDVGVNKPDRRLFSRALGDLGVPVGGPAMMVGNRLERDISGANRIGLTTVWLSSGPRYRKVPQTPEEVPDHTIARLPELLALVR
jgi:putative hydrolase of the HAD superfamily